PMPTKGSRPHGLLRVHHASGRLKALSFGSAEGRDEAPRLDELNDLSGIDVSCAPSVGRDETERVVFLRVGHSPGAVFEAEQRRRTRLVASQIELARFDAMALEGGPHVLPARPGRQVEGGQLSQTVVLEKIGDGARGGP